MKGALTNMGSEAAKNEQCNSRLHGRTCTGMENNLCQRWHGTTIDGNTHILGCHFIATSGLKKKVWLLPEIWPGLWIYLVVTTSWALCGWSVGYAVPWTSVEAKKLGAHTVILGHEYYWRPKLGERVINLETCRSASVFSALSVQAE